MHSRNSGVDPNTPQAVAPVKAERPTDAQLVPKYENNGSDLCDANSAAQPEKVLLAIVNGPAFTAS